MKILKVKMYTFKELTPLTQEKVIKAHRKCYSFLNDQDAIESILSTYPNESFLANGNYLLNRLEKEDYED
jgi:hypothetical protein